MKVILIFWLSVADGGYSNLLTMRVADGGYSNLLTMSVADEGYSNILTMSVADEGYSNILTWSKGNRTQRLSMIKRKQSTKTINDQKETEHKDYQW